MKENRWGNAGLLSVLSVCLALTLASCGGTSGTSGTSEAASSGETSTEPASSAAAETATPETESTAAETGSAESGAENDAGKEDGGAGSDWGYEEGEPIEVETGRFTRKWYDPAIAGDDSTEIASADIDQLHLTEDGMLQWKYLSDALDQWNEQEKKRSIDELQSAMEGLEAGGMFPYSTSTGISVRRADTEALSFLAGISSYYGGAHPNTVYEAVNLDPETGREIALTDVVSDPAKLPEILKEALLKENPGLEDSALGDIAETLQQYKTSDYHWTLERDGIRFWFEPYAIAAYAAGPQTVELAFADYPDLFTGRGQHAPQASICKYNQYGVISTTAEDGTIRNYQVTGETDENGAYARIEIQYWNPEENSENPDSESFEQYCYSWTPYLVTKDGGRYLWLFTKEDNDWTTLYVYDLTGGAPSFVAKLDGLAPAVRNTETENMFQDSEEQSGAHTEDYPDSYRTVELTNPDSFKLEKRLQVLSTYGGIKTYRTDASGLPTSDDKVYEAANHIRLQTKTDVRMYQSDPDTLQQGEEVTVPAGTNLSIAYTDGEKKVWLIAEDGTCLLAVLTENPDGWQDLIDGRPIDEVFDGLLFAG